MGTLDMHEDAKRDMRKRIKRMHISDILECSYDIKCLLTCTFEPSLIRLMVSRGEDKREKEIILEDLKNTYEWWLRGLTGNERNFYIDIMGYPPDKLPDYDEISLDIATYEPLLSDEEENADDNSPLSNPNSSPLGEAERGLLEARIAELEKENEALRQQLAPEEHCEEEEHCPEEGVLRNKVSFECFLQLLEQAGCDLNNTGNKTRAGALWHMMTGKSAHELRRYCSGRDYNNNHTKTDIARLDTLLSDLGITSLKLRQ